MEKWAQSPWLRPNGLGSVGCGCNWQGNDAKSILNGLGPQGPTPNTHEGIHTHS